MLEPSRRGLITGIASLIAAPALVRATSLMPISTKINYLEPGELIEFQTYEVATTEFVQRYLQAIIRARTDFLKNTRAHRLPENLMKLGVKHVNHSTFASWLADRAGNVDRLTGLGAGREPDENIRAKATTGI